MKSLMYFIISLVIISCNVNRSDQTADNDEYSFNDLTVSFVRNTRVTTFIKDGKAISGVVTQDLNNGGKNIWEVENGLATKQTMFYPNGQMRRMLEMKNGVENGTFVMFYSDGTKSIEQFYKNGEPVGVWHRWNRDGEVIETIEY